MSLPHTPTFLLFRVTLALLKDVRCFFLKESVAVLIFNVIPGYSILFSPLIIVYIQYIILGFSTFLFDLCDTARLPEEAEDQILLICH